MKLHEDSNNSLPVNKLPHCTEGFVNSVPEYIRVTAAVTCALSMLGALLIVTTFFCFKRHRSKAREIIFNISLMDFTVSLANFVGIAVDFDSLLYRPTNPYGAESPPHVHSDLHIINDLCISQAAFAIYGTISSVMWTTSLTIYFYIVIMSDGGQMANRAVYGFYVICYGLPLIVVGWLGWTGKIGYNPVGGGGWCSLIFTAVPQDRFRVLFGYNIWMYITICVVLTTTLSIVCHLKIQVQKDSISHQARDTVRSLELKLLAIPVLFIALRVWTFMLTFFTLDIPIKSCTLVLFFLGMGAVGDSGQGFFNAVIFCIMNKRIRMSYKALCVKYFRCCLRKVADDEKEDDSIVTTIGVESEAAVIEEEGSHELAKPYSKRWHSQSRRSKINF